MLGLKVTVARLRMIKKCISELGCLVCLLDLVLSCTSCIAQVENETI